MVYTRCVLFFFPLRHRLPPVRTALAGQYVRPPPPIGGAPACGSQEPLRVGARSHCLWEPGASRGGGSCSCVRVGAAACVRWLAALSTLMGMHGGVAHTPHSTHPFLALGATYTFLALVSAHVHMHDAMAPWPGCFFCSRGFQILVVAVPLTIRVWWWSYVPWLLLVCLNLWFSDCWASCCVLRVGSCSGRPGGGA